MSKYTPTTEQISAACAIFYSEKQFNEWLAERDRQVEAHGIRKAADAWHAENGGTSPRAYHWMWEYAEKLEKS